jgi:hypothetical protein
MAYTAANSADRCTHVHGTRFNEWTNILVPSETVEVRSFLGLSGFWGLHEFLRTPTNSIRLYLHSTSVPLVRTSWFCSKNLNKKMLKYVLFSFFPIIPSDLFTSQKRKLRVSGFHACSMKLHHKCITRNSYLFCGECSSLVELVEET